MKNFVENPRNEFRKTKSDVIDAIPFVGKSEKISSGERYIPPPIPVIPARMPIGKLIRGNDFFLILKFIFLLPKSFKKDIMADKIRAIPRIIKKFFSFIFRFAPRIVPPPPNK